MNKDDPMDFRDSKVNVSRKLMALEGGKEIKRFKNDPTRFKRQYTPYDVAMLAPPGDCRQNCSYCSAEFMKSEYSKIVESLGHSMSTDINETLVFKVLDQLVDCGTRAITLTGGGDWSVYPWLPDIIEHGKSVGLELGLISHFAGRKFFDADLERIVDNTEWLRASLDGYDTESYNKIRRPDNADDFDNMQNNIRQIAEIMRRKGHNRELFGVQMLVCRENYDWVPQVVKFAASLGVGYIQIRPIELRGRLVSVDGVSQDSGQQRYADKYDGFWQLERAAQLAKGVQGYGGIDVVFRQDKVDVIYRDGSFTELPKESFKHCVGSHFAGNIVITNPVVLTQCFWRYDHAMIVDVENGDTLKDAFFSEERSEFYERADNSRCVCSNLCKYAIFNPEWERTFADLSSKEFSRVVDQFNQRIARGEVRIVNPYFL